jgi:negative regulator of sigma E activity
MQATIGDLLRRKLITTEAAASLLRVSEGVAAEQIREMTASWQPAEDPPGE